MITRLLFRKLLCIAAFLTGISAQAQLTYVTNADGVSLTITGYSNSVPTTIVIPTNIDGLTVTAIGVGAFAGITDLNYVTIPSTVTTLEEGAFTGSGLTSVTILYGVTTIAEGAFSSCDYLTNVVIPESVTYIGHAAFTVTGLLNLTIPGSVTNFGSGAFDDDEYLTNVIIEPGITSLAGGVFGGDPNIGPSVIIPASMTNLQDDAFGGCASLTAVFFMGNAPAVDNTSFLCKRPRPPPPAYPIITYYVATAYYLPGTMGWDEFTSNTVVTPDENRGVTTNISVPAVMWNPTIQTASKNFGIQNGQYGFDITAPTNLPIAIEACDDISQSNWIVLQRLTLTNGLYHFSEPFDTSKPSRFYRIGFP